MGNSVFISGSTGYLGRPLAQRLVNRGWTVKALARSGSLDRVPGGCVPVTGDALRAETFRAAVDAGSTFVHLTGVAHPSPAKAAAFRAIDQVSFEASLDAAIAARAAHFVYVSVAHPAPVMAEYIAVRKKCESMLQESRLHATILRPWYVLGPGHRWPYALKPFYALAEWLPSFREPARRLGLVTHRQMVDALLWSVLHCPDGVRTFDVPAIRVLGTTSAAAWASMPVLWTR